MPQGKMTEKDEISGILQAADKHPNSRVSKLIRCVQEECSQKNIVLLLIELAEHAEYASEFGISLKYYLDMFERLGHGRDIVLNEAGLLLLNSSKIYARRVDYIHDLVEHQLLTLSKADREIAEGKSTQQANSAANAETTPKPKRGRKRLLAASTDPYEVELVPKKFRKLSENKRLAINRPMTKVKTLRQHIVETEQYLHPAVWVHASIVDLENEEEIDSKRNYKLFTYHVEHRYNTLVPDINFRLHFKVKDYMDEAEERLMDECGESAESGNGNCNRENGNEAAITWPPLSEEYVQKYLNLENRILEQELLPKRTSLRIEPDKENVNNIAESTDSNCTLKITLDNSAAIEGLALEIYREKATVEHTTAAQEQALETVQNSNSAEESIAEPTTAACSETFQDDSALGQSILDATNTNANSTKLNESENATGQAISATGDVLETSASEIIQNDSALERSLLDVSENSVQPLDTSTEAHMLEKSGTELLLQNDSALGESLTELNDTQNTSAAKTLQDLEANANDVAEAVEKSLADGENAGGHIEKARGNAEQEKEKDVINPQTPAIDVLPSDKDVINLEGIRVHLPHLDDEGVFFTELDEHECRMLSPTVVATDVFPSVPNKKNLTIIVDDEIKALLNLQDDEPETYVLPAEKPPIVQPIVLNILKIHEKFLRRRSLFKLGPEMDVYMKARSLKRTRGIELRECRQTKMLKRFPLNSTDLTGVYASPAPSPGHDMESDFYGFTDTEDDERSREFLGFSEEEQAEALLLSHRLSRDSGVCVDSSVVTTKLDTIVEERDNALNMAKTMEHLADDSRAQQNTGVLGVESVAKNKEQHESLEAMGASTESSVTKETDSTIATEVTIEAVTRTENSTVEEATETTTSKENVDSLTCVQNDEVDDDELQSAVTNALNLERKNGTHSFEQDFNETLAEMDLHGSKTKIQKWHDHLQPILAKSRERHHFDVFQLGTEIISKIGTVQEQTQECENEYVVEATPAHITFQDVMENKDVSYVSRYFLSTLLLANQSNIGIKVWNKCSEGPTAWSDIQLKLLSTKRHTVAIEDNIGMINSSKTRTRTAATASKAQASKPPAPTLINCNSSSSSSSKTAAPNVNLNVVRPLKEVEKLPRVSDDYDSGIFSSEELAL